MADAGYRFTLDTGRVAATAQPIIARKVASVTRRIAAQAKLNAPVRTGNLARSIQEGPIVFQGPFRVTSGVTATANYAAAVHDGTRPHVIRARNGGFLRFPGSDGSPVFRRSVNHPGTRPRPFLRNAAEQVMRSENLRQ
ncbi:HK97 gp10 family phage protein [Rhodococcus sp. Z13]|uniref:HK97 gp10 family phage protein n=1 Tax=Rhodococcus sacchari TaxID=2962047 RepID=A0ACD4DCJ2_9NOCA|nr:HK97 gp10 family phage protein [Rhodococcus sp. Z13]UYP17712.1 HK97 gp10 family phage protein [Rhodococcus sp. Z13]